MVRCKSPSKVPETFFDAVINGRGVRKVYGGLFSAILVGR